MITPKKLQLPIRQQTQRKKHCFYLIEQLPSRRIGRLPLCMQLLPNRLSIKQGFLVFRSHVASRQCTVKWWKRIFLELRVKISTSATGFWSWWIFSFWIIFFLVAYLQKVSQATLEVFCEDPLAAHQLLELTQLLVPLPQAHKKIKKIRYMCLFISLPVLLFKYL